MARVGFTNHIIYRFVLCYLAKVYEQKIHNKDIIKKYMLLKFREIRIKVHTNSLKKHIYNKIYIFLLLYEVMNI